MNENTEEGQLAFKKLIEQSSSGITLLDAQFNVIYRSPSAELINGWDTSIRKKDDIPLNIHPDDRPRVNVLLKHVARHPASSETCTFRSKHFNGNYIWLKCCFTNMLHEPNVNSIVCNFNDVSEQKLNEDQLNQKSEQITELLQTMTDGFFSLDKNLCYTYVNEQALLLSHKTREELIGKYIWDVFPDVVGSATYEAIRTAFNEKKYVCNQDYYAPSKLWQENRIYPSANGLSIFIRDITIHKNEERHLKLLESVITNTKDAVLITEVESFDFPGPRILYVNEAFTHMTGYTAEEVLGRTPRMLQGPNTDKDELKRMHDCIRNMEICDFTIINYKKNGEEFWVQFSLTPVSNEVGQFTHYISIERDVTEQKNQELQRLKYLNAIEAQNIKFKEISWMQSHVVRAPLARLMGLISLLDISEELPDETKKIMDYVMQSAAELDEVIHSITLKTEISNPKLN
ncbi:hypothetical protein A5893_08175 [Pedobacter psychrophilus]|uniref:Histidine kinase n=1 Tax=Pedobacter psychrophilus TaxID=1826909 RepID=A0A179DFI0_9SPHI|nr:PAS domain-containing protein [Pedobacter psychrophilus]OAQ39562.1 hypothetical protein A5893_08175 [Pedobacter psychrophilus]